MSEWIFHDHNEHAPVLGSSGVSRTWWTLSKNEYNVELFSESLSPAVSDPFCLSLPLSLLWHPSCLESKRCPLCFWSGRQRQGTEDTLMTTAGLQGKAPVHVATPTLSGRRLWIQSLLCCYCLKLHKITPLDSPKILFLVPK